MHGVYGAHGWMISTRSTSGSLKGSSRLVRACLSFRRRHCATSTKLLESSDLLIAPSKTLHCFDLCFVRPHRRRKAPYANLVHIASDWEADKAQGRPPLMVRSIDRTSTGHLISTPIPGSSMHCSGRGCCSAAQGGDPRNSTEGHTR